MLPSFAFVNFVVYPNDQFFYSYLFLQFRFSHRALYISEDDLLKSEDVVIVWHDYTAGAEQLPRNTFN